MVGRRSIACPYQITSQKETPDASIKPNRAVITKTVRASAPKRVSDQIYGLDANPKYKCVICDLRFYHKKSLEAHRLRHTDTLPKYSTEFPPPKSSEKNSEITNRTKNTKANANKNEQTNKNHWMVRLANLKRRLINSLKL